MCVQFAVVYVMLMKSLSLPLVELSPVLLIASALLVRGLPPGRAFIGFHQHDASSSFGYRSVPPSGGRPDHQPIRVVAAAWRLRGDDSAETMTLGPFTCPAPCRHYCKGAMVLGLLHRWRCSSTGLIWVEQQSFQSSLLRRRVWDAGNAWVCRNAAARALVVGIHCHPDSFVPQP